MKIIDFQLKMSLVVSGLMSKEWFIEKENYQKKGKQN